MRIIEQKCRAEGRKEFEFLQAHYSRRSQKIELLLDMPLVGLNATDV